MPRTVSPETANRIYAVWMQAVESGEETTIANVMKRAGLTGTDHRSFLRYRRQVEEQFNCCLPPLNKHAQIIGPERAERYESEKPYTAVVFSDAHWWSKTLTPAHSILLQVLRDVQPEIVIDNGDSWDGSAISRFSPNMWEHKPTLKEEMDVVLYHRDGIKGACDAERRYVCIGNHDMRFEAYLASHVPEARDMPGTKISDLFPGWEHTLSVVLNDTIIIKHRFRGGIHAAHNNVLWAGMHIATGHLHRLRCIPLTNYRGTFYGIETGTLADPHGEQFFYTEDNPLNWQSGFVVLSLDGPRLNVELVEVQDNKAFFRGQWYTA